MTTTTARPLRVGLWGFYAYGHFGDDLAGAIIGSHLQRTHGAPVRVYGLCEPYVRRFGLERVANVDELVEDSDIVVYGGGSTLESSPPPARRFGLAATIPTHARDSGRVIELARQRNLPVVGISIGGDGKYPRVLQPASKSEFLETARYISVRYRDDLRLLQESGKAGDYFPDLLWSASTQFPRVRGRNDRLRIGINLYAGQLLAARAWLAPLLAYLGALRRRDVEFIFLDSANATKERFRALPRLPGITGTNIQFREPEEDLSTIASLDALISTQLPLGIVAMSYGVPFFAVAPEPKTERLMHEVGAAHACYSREQSSKLFRALASRRAWQQLCELALPDERERLCTASLGHLRALSREVEGVAVGR